MKITVVKLQCLVVSLFSVCMIATCVCFYLLAELVYLDEARVRLEMMVMRLEQEKLYMTRQQLSAPEDLEGVDFGNDDAVVIYNRIPKTGSTTLAGIMYSLCFTNRYFVIHIGMMDRAKTIALSDQMRFLQNITNWQEKKPALYHGHMAFIDYTKFGIKRKPIYINMIRNPLDRLVSFYYFTRYGDDIRPSKERMKVRIRETFDECVQRNGEDCNADNLWLQIPYFCGHVAECWIPGNEWALTKAKQNVLQRYLVVGTTEEMEDFILVLEALLPRFFKGGSKLYKIGEGSHLRRTTNKQPLKEETVGKIRSSSIWQMENEFYDFVRNQFHIIKDQLFDIDQHGNYIKKTNKYQYEKIRPI